MSRIGCLICVYSTAVAVGINTRVRKFSQRVMVWMLEQLRNYTTRDIWKFFQIALA